MKHDVLLQLKEGKVNCSVRALSAKEYDFFDKVDENGWPIYLARNNRWYKAFPPYGDLGSTLWVREYYRKEEDGSITYRVDADPENKTPRKEWSPLVGMKEKESRFDLTVTKYRFLSGIQDLTTEDIRNAGFGGIRPREDFLRYWNLRYRDRILKWESNPAVWVTHFDFSVRKK